MLEEIPTERRNRKVFRLSRLHFDDEQNSQFMRELELGDREESELLEWISNSVSGENLEDYLDFPFRHNLQLKRKTRFSDGSFPVFYSSLEFETAECEVKYHLSKFVSNPNKLLTAYYTPLKCTFEGEEKDLRPKVGEWPELLDDSHHYEFCNQIGEEAVKLKLDGILTYSARRKEGTNMPIFSRNAIGNPESKVLLALTYDPKTKEFTVKALDR